jgi:orotidine-5'-phosphate decarboxylase
VDSVRAAFDSDGLGAVVNSSRGVIFAWEQEPYDKAYGSGRWREAVRAAASDMRALIWDATH